MSADDADRLDRKRKKKNPDQGFSGTVVMINLLDIVPLRLLSIEGTM